MKLSRKTCLFWGYVVGLLIPKSSPEDCHQRAWTVVGDYLTSSMRLFSGKSVDADSTVLPATASWIQEAFSEIPSARSYDDHGVIVWTNLPTAGILGASKYDFMVTAIANLLTTYRKNSMAIIVHVNRASQMNGSRTGFNQTYMNSLIIMVHTL